MAWDRDKERKVAGSYHIGMSVFGLVFAIFWCCAAAAMGAGFMLIFGIPFVGMMIFHLVTSIKMMQKEKSKSAADPWERPTAEQKPPQPDVAGSSANGYCPYCGSATNETFQFCPKCGRRLSHTEHLRVSE